MDLLTQDFDSISHRDVVDFCDQKIIEGTQLDYKKVIPNSLKKHFAAMSNRFGGLIIVGVEEDSKTGTPAVYEGIVNDGKQVDRVHQAANNVRPLPGYAVRTTNDVNGKVFLLIRIYEGDAPPYRVVNDPTVYLRTGNITTPLGPADANVIEELYAKRAGAESVRQQNAARADFTLRQAIDQRANIFIELNTPDPTTGKINVQKQRLQQHIRLLTAHLQPFFPRQELALPREIRDKLPSLRVRNNLGQEFPSPGMKPIARGLLSFDGTGADFSFSSDQIYANGLAFHAENTVGPHLEFESELHLSAIARAFYSLLLFGKNLYNELGYGGLVQGGITLEAARGRRVRPIVPLGRNPELIDQPTALNDSYDWLIEADTHQLNDPKWVDEYFYTQMREIYWDLGVEDVSRELIEAYIKSLAFQ